jgi:hypothetical protein
MLQYGLQFEDIAYIAAKNRTGLYKTAEEMPKELNDFILSNNKQDLKQWELANKKLDEKILRLRADCGDLFNATLSLFDDIQNEIFHECSAYRKWYGTHGFGEPYSYWRDLGMGPRCVQYTVRKVLAPMTKIPVPQQPGFIEM